jgi:hypothetical protein
MVDDLALQIEEKFSAGRSLDLSAMRKRAIRQMVGYRREQRGGSVLPV